MSYRKEKRRRPGLPPRIKDLEGKLAVVRRRMVTGGGTVFVPGDRLIVEYTTCGNLHLKDPEDRKRFIRRVEPANVYFPEFGEEA